ncbi:GDSL esterase/lipase [Vitis vinifera]|uniref:GDSL esterase/lipase n=1 Tax=Vitis vinifera TaxID=29760 RepID=A0A438DEG7_VITVI|nr:GDSL esterase/lipase [Vitis vinifera]
MVNSASACILKIRYEDSFTIPQYCRTNNYHRRAVVASLVEGAYNLEYDRQESRDPQVQSSCWWNLFHFQLKRALVDDKDSSIYGAVYEIKHTYLNHLPKCAPKYVIAFRGTILKLSTAKRDLKLNIKVLTDVLHMDRHRFKPALEAVQQVVQEAGSANIWLAGHSLGSSIAMMDAMRLTDTLCNFGTLFVGGGHVRQGQYDQFNALSSWIPNLFVNRHNPIFTEYIGHFRNRNNVEKQFGAGMIGRVAVLQPTLGVLKAAVGMDPQLSTQILPKAYLTISESSSSCSILEAHGLRQWWYHMSLGPAFADLLRKKSISDPVLMGGP